MNKQQAKDDVLWYVMRAYRNENKAEAALSSDWGLPYFIPKRYCIQTCHGKKVKRLVPAIPGMVFVHASREQLTKFKLRCPFLQYVMWKVNGGLEFITVPDRQMDNFIKVASHTEESVKYYSPEEVHLVKGQHIRIVGGAFDGAEGVFVKEKRGRNRRLVVTIQGVTAVSVQVQPECVEVIP